MGDPGGNLDELLAKVPRDVALARNLWPGIAHSIQRRPRTLGVFALAAVLGIVCVAGGVIWAMLQGRLAVPGATAVLRARAVGFDEPHDPAYLAARAELEKSFNERLASLDPQTRTQIEASLALIRQAHEQIRQALADQPANPILEHLLESTLHDEFDLYDNVVRGTQSTLIRS